MGRQILGPLRQGFAPGHVRLHHQLGNQGTGGKGIAFRPARGLGMSRRFLPAPGLIGLTRCAHVGMGGCGKDQAKQKTGQRSHACEFRSAAGHRKVQAATFSRL